MIGSFLNRVLNKSNNIYRWEGMDRQRPFSDAEHTWAVCVIADMLCRIQVDKFGYDVNPLKLLRKGLYHDVIEIETGDILSGVKKTIPEMKECLGKIEKIKFDENIGPLIPKKYRKELEEYILNPKDNFKTIEGKILAVADKIDALRECIAEVKKGNTNFLPYLQSVTEEILDLKVECGLYFVKYSLIDFGIQIDKFGPRVKKFVETYEFEDLDNYIE